MSYRPIEKVNIVQKSVDWGDKTLTEINDVLAAPDQTVPIHGKSEMDECRRGCLHERKWILQTQTRWMDADQAWAVSVC